jgi:hypothetical protein
VKLRVIPHNRISTKGSDGQSNGFLVPIYSVHDRFIPEERKPKQVYLTVCSPGARKGPHLHLRRWGYFTCIRGNARVVAKLGNEYAVEYTGEDHGFKTIEVPAGVPSMLENVGKIEAYVINLGTSRTRTTIRSPAGTLLRWRAADAHGSGAYADGRRSDNQSSPRSVEFRRKSVGKRVRLTNELTQLLKEYFPAAVDCAGDLDKVMACDFLLEMADARKIAEEPTRNHSYLLPRA